MSRVYLSTTFWRLHSPVTEVLTALRDRGIRAVELGSIHCYEADLASVLPRFGMRYLVHNYFPPPRDGFVANIASSSDEVRTRSIAHAKESITFTRTIGGGLYTVHPGFVTDPSGESLTPTSYDFVFRRSGTTGKEESAHERTFERFLDALRELSRHAAREDIPLAVESQGSVAQSDQLIMQTPEEFRRVMAEFSPHEVGFNINVGHLNLAARVFGFDRLAFVGEVARHTLAMELSHNEGMKDEHGALVRDAWYWDVIGHPALTGAYRIFEGRNLDLDTACAMVALLHERSAAARAPTQITGNG